MTAKQTTQKCTPTSGRKSGSNSLKNTHSAKRVLKKAKSPQRSKSITSSPTREARNSFGIPTIGNRYVQAVTRLKRLLRTAASVVMRKLRCK